MIYNHWILPELVYACHFIIVYINVSSKYLVISITHLYLQEIFPHFAKTRNSLIWIIEVITLSAIITRHMAVLLGVIVFNARSESVGIKSPV